MLPHDKKNHCKGRADKRCLQPFSLIELLNTSEQLCF